MTVMDLLRHGELEGGVKYRGNLEEALTRAGRAEMDAVWRQLGNKVETIITSPLGRCRQPAEDWAAAADIPCLVEDRIREMHYGEWEGLTRQEIEAHFPGLLEKWRANPVGVQIPGAELIEDFAERVRQGMWHILNECAGTHVLVVVHSGSMRIMLAEALGAPLSSTRRFVTPFAAWSRILHNGNAPYLEYLNRRP